MKHIRSRAIQLAGEALDLGIRGDSRDAIPTVQRIFVETGTDGLQFAMRAWIEVLLKSMDVPQVGGAVMAYVTDEGIMENSDDLEPHDQWAARLILAVQACDWERWGDLIDVLPAQSGLYIGALFTQVSETLKKQGASGALAVNLEQFFKDDQS